MTGQATSVEETIRQRAEAWLEAIRRKDMAALEEFLADEYVLVNVQGVIDRATWLHALQHRIQGRGKGGYVDPEVRVYGEVAVMLTGWHQEATMDGKDWSGDFRITDTWVWRDGRWQVVLRHSTHYR
jgi:ketosteroid isomerase-like protein